MVKTRRNVRRGGGYQTSQQFFNPNVLPSTSLLGLTPTTAVNAAEIRPVLYSTFQSGAGARHSTRKTHGGFSPSIMGPFVANAQAAIVPLAAYAAYHYLVPKKDGKSRRGGARRRVSRKQRK